MNTNLVQNPFPFAGYRGPEFFCNRIAETKKLISNIINGNNTTLFSARRLGKTALLHHVFHLLKNKRIFVPIYVDIQPTSCLSDFINVLARAVLRIYNEKSSFWNKFMEFLKSLRPLISYDPLSGQPQISIHSISEKESENSLYRIFQFLGLQDKSYVIAMDEFQQINSYPEKNTEALLRSYIQEMKNCIFIFSGSQEHLLSEMFVSPKRPFFASTQMMKLLKIDTQEYVDFIYQKLSDNSFNISKENIYYVLDWTRGNTFYTQIVCNRLFQTGIIKQDKRMIQETLISILKENETIFYGYKNLLTDSQWHLLKAIAKDNRVTLPMSNDFIGKHRLNGPATVRQSLNSLIKKELILKDTDIKGKIYYEVYDLFLSRWLEQYL